MVPEKATRDAVATKLPVHGKSPLVTEIASISGVKAETEAKRHTAIVILPWLIASSAEGVAKRTLDRVLGTRSAKPSVIVATAEAATDAQNAQWD